MRRVPIEAGTAAATIMTFGIAGGCSVVFISDSAGRGLLRNQLPEIGKQVVLIQPGGVHDALCIGRLVQLLQPPTRIVERVAIVIRARKRPESQTREERKAQRPFLVIPG